MGESQQNRQRYSKQVAAQIAAMIQEMGFRYHFFDEVGLFRLSFDLRKTALKNAVLYILVEDKTYTSGAVCPLRVPKARMAAVSEYILRINRRMKLCSFTLDCDSGELRTHCSVPFRGLVPWPDVLEASIRLPIELYEEYGDGLLSVMFGSRQPKEAAHAALRE